MTILFFILIGLFSIAAGILNWDWFMENSRARFFVRIFGRSGARIFYVALGVFIIVVSFL